MIDLRNRVQTFSKGCWLLRPRAESLLTVDVGMCFPWGSIQGGLALGTWRCVFPAMWHWVRAGLLVGCFLWGISNLCWRPESESCCLCPHSKDLVWSYKWQKIQLVGMAQRRENPHFLSPISRGAWLACTKVSGKCIWFNPFCLRRGFNFSVLGSGYYPGRKLTWKITMFNRRWSRYIFNMLVFTLSC